MQYHDGVDESRCPARTCHRGPFEGIQPEPGLQPIRGAAAVADPQRDPEGCAAVAAAAGGPCHWGMSRNTCASSSVKAWELHEPRALTPEA